MPPARLIDNIDLFHERIVSQIGPASGNLGVVEREISQPPAPIPPRQPPNLPGAYPAMPVENHHIGPRPIDRAGQRDFGNLASGHGIRVFLNFR